MALISIFEFETKPGQESNFVEFLRRILPETRQFPGNIKAQAARLNDHQFMASVEWSQAGALAKYLDWRKERGDFAQLLTFLNHEPTIHTYESLVDI
ncbi:hypothetical protein BS333_13835 [Vibrio azureus]|uniref:ABM domain-containing protein n=1 Tax=Vibrio azureus NBRC 104587 TaxID=1219077 RepID=U3AVK7_9VIBR|nr:antibiotic biosynthesis monooxygenase [Vibrio azureus]AUI87498.1 hypothetical protein BS333_13835 [Vibrio azureus]GAD77262.1 hypothetical protein VAZ01S_069_00100 [Vibrio azureus NBRC 104587]